MRTAAFLLAAASLLGLPALAAADTVNISNATVRGQQETVLTNAHGMTLYYIARPGPQPCVGASCARIWPPLIAPYGKFTAPASLRGKLSVIRGPFGPQLAYTGHPLYGFIGDSRPGQANGQGLHDPWGVWWMATPAQGTSQARSSGSSW
ncbi:hypothetical protein BW247_06565 [Acidihalobacter ferrooxydans]|uniref:Lipoprotein n=1 Tax=Acidihalobacter ferrooxydans TaxID=1765967 RepID=A0A1P8UL95_9GAMM|nr:hypothetical protein BW247_06565 [Acidihalobacter ferrooxydans]